jgi:Flp pilus assembly protein TadG
VRPAHRNRSRDDRGAILVEAAFVLPFLLLLFLGLADLANLSLQNSQASSTARDGARVAILHYNQADVPGSADAITVTDAVSKRLADKPRVTVSVKCYPTGSSASPESCSSADPGSDFVEVKVSWAAQPLSFVGATFTPSLITASSRMAIVGLPIQVAPSTTTSSTSTTSTTSTSLPATCAASRPAVTLPSPFRVTGNHLSSDVLVTVTMNGASDCLTATLQLKLTSGPGMLASPYSPTTQTTTTAIFTLGAKDGWNSGSTYNFTVYLNGQPAGSLALTPI